MALLMSVMRAAACAAVVLSAAVVAPGCQVPSALWYKTMGPPPIPARYPPPKDQPLLVLIENVHSGAQALPEADALAHEVYDDLKSNNVAPMIDPGTVHDLRDQNPAKFDKMTIAEVGRHVGAKQIIYIHVSQLNLENPPGSDVVRVKIAAKVRVVDVPSARTVWPENGEGEVYNYESRYERVLRETTRTGLSRQVLRAAGSEIARWFYDFKPETMGEENQDVKLR